MLNQKAQNIIILSCLIVLLISQYAIISQYTIISPVLTAPSVPTAPPWVKQNILIETKSSMGTGMNVWTDNPIEDRNTINGIEGVINTILVHNDHMIYVQIDPRYDEALVAKAIEDRLIEKSLYGSSPLLTH